MDEVRLAKSFWVIEHVGGVVYDRFVSSLKNQDIASTFTRFAGHEHQHADWYCEWLAARGHTVPNGGNYEALVVPVVRALLAPASLDRKLRVFSAAEQTAARHLTSLAGKVRDPELRAIIERTIPYEQMHGQWYSLEGRRMLSSREESGLIES
jgi:rubrerythrin